MRYCNQVIVFTEEEEHFLLITYYKYIPDDLRAKTKEIRSWMKKKIKPILSGKKENRRIRNINRHIKKYNIQKFSKMDNNSLYNRFR